MSRSTPAVQSLERAGVAFALVVYDYDPKAQRIGLQAAEAIGASPSEVFKTLMALVDGKPVCAVLPSDEEVNMKKLAAALGGKSAQMMKPADAERVTGYKIGGVSPLGQRRASPTILDETALLHDEIYLNGGQRGLQIRLRPQDLVQALNCATADLTR